MDHRYERDVFLLTKPGNVQDLLLDRYRLTDAFRAEYIRHMLSTKENEAAVGKALAAAGRHFGDPAPELSRYDGLVGDMLYTCYVMGFYYNEYFGYGLAPLSIRRRLDFIPEQNRTAYVKILNPYSKDNERLALKHEAASVLGDDFGRASVIARRDGDFEAFRTFALLHPRFFAKPSRGSLGEGARIIDTGGFSARQLRLLFNRLKKEKHGTFCEELIWQDAAMAAFHPASVNSVRAITYIGRNGRPRLIGGCLRAGRGGTVVDNTAAGGLYAAFDVSTGEVVTDAVDKRGGRHSTHPDSGAAFRGFRIPAWDGLLDTACRCALKFPRIRLVGWDLALSGGAWKVIEGNSYPHFTSTQMCFRAGMRDQFERDVEWEANRRAAAKRKP